MRILCVDPGEKNIGLAISDPTGTIANPLSVLQHTARQSDAEAIVKLALENEAQEIVVGQSLNLDGEPTYQGRRAARLAAAIRSQTELPVLLWDESYSTQTARMARITLNTSRKKRHGHLDDLAAVVILQSYLDHKSDQINHSTTNGT
jgi:putative holliday junction resolvase